MASDIGVQGEIKKFVVTLVVIRHVFVLRGAPKLTEIDQMAEAQILRNLWHSLYFWYSFDTPEEESCIP